MRDAITSDSKICAGRNAGDGFKEGGVNRRSERVCRVARSEGGLRRRLERMLCADEGDGDLMGAGERGREDEDTTVGDV